MEEKKRSKEGNRTNRSVTIIFLKLFITITVRVTVRLPKSLPVRTIYAYIILHELNGHIRYFL